MSWWRKEKRLEACGKTKERGKSMTPKEIIAQLEDLKTDRESFLDKDDPEDVFQRDIDALDGAVKIIKRLLEAGEPDDAEKTTRERCIEGERNTRRRTKTNE